MTQPPPDDSLDTPSAADPAKGAEGTSQRFSSVMARLREKRRAAQPAGIPTAERSPGPDGAVRLAASSGQERLWFLYRLDPEDTAYNVSSAVRLEGPLAPAALARALQGIVRRHESLRTTFETAQPTTGEAPSGGGGAGIGARQVIAPPEAAPRIPLPVVDWGGLPEGVPGTLPRLARRVVARPFDLERGPLLRFVLVRLAPESHVLVVVLHHIVSDGWSIGVLLREAITDYQTFLRGGRSLLEPPPVQYPDYALWQRGRLSGGELDPSLDFWRGQLGDRPPVLSLPADRPRPPERSGRGAKRPLRWPAERLDALKALARGEGTTLFVVLTALWQLLLARLSGETDVPIGTAVAGRTRSELQGLIGFFVNTLVLRADLAEARSFREHLERLHTVVLEAQAHQELPFDRLVEVLAPERDLSHTPLFQAALAFQNVPMPRQELADLTLSPVDVDGGTAMFDTTLDLEETDAGLEGWIEYTTDLFDPATVDGWARRLEVLAEAALAHPETDPWALPLLTAAERREVLEAGRARAAEEATDASPFLHRRFEAWAARRGGETAVVVPGGERLTYGQVEETSRRLAALLRSRGVAPGTPVGLLLERSAWTVLAILAVHRAGGAYVPLDPAHPADRWAYQLRDAGARLLLTRGNLAEPLAESLADRDDLEVLDLEVLDLDGLDLEGLDLPRAPEELTAAELHPNHPAYVIYTSGSTGRPKGVMVTHGNASRLFDTAARAGFDFGPEDVWTLFHSYAFDFSVWELWGALARGGRLVVVPWEVSRSPEDFLALLAREGVTVLNQTPSAFRQLIRAEGTAAAPPPLALRWVVFGGEALELASLAPWFERHGDRTPRLVNMYGITETTVHVTHRPLKATDLETARAGSPIGQPLPDLSLQVVDPRGEPVPPGAVGEMVIGGAGLARGYLGRPALTAERFVPDPFSGRAGERLYRSGDLGRDCGGSRLGGSQLGGSQLGDRDLEYRGRIDHQVKIRGFRIELGEIEARLAAHPAVSEAVVTLLDRQEEGGDDQRLVAYLVPDEERAGPLRRRLELEAAADEDQPLPASYELPDGRLVFHLNNSETAFLWEEIFDRASYLRHGIGLPPGAVVFDVGANIGFFSLFVHDRSPGARVYAFEPMAPVFRVLEANAALFGIGGERFPLGLADRPREVEFTYYPNVSVISGYRGDPEQERQVVRALLTGRHGQEGSRTAGAGVPGSTPGTMGATGDGEAPLSSEDIEALVSERLESRRVTARLVTLSSIIESRGVERIDLLKIDVEKAELEVLQGLRDEDWGKVRQIVIEVHDVDGRRQAVEALLEAHGFTWTPEQETDLAGTPLVNLYAVRPDDPVEAAEVAADEPTWTSPDGLLEELRARAAEGLPEYMVPTAWVLLPQLPLTPNGKVDRKALPAPESRGARAGRVAPRNPTEEALAAIWQRVLKVPEVGVSDNFFQLGGHSLLATQIATQIEKDLEVKVPLKELFAAPTVEALARVVEATRKAAAERPPETAGPRPRIAAQPRSAAGRPRIPSLPRRGGGSSGGSAPLPPTRGVRPPSLPGQRRAAEKPSEPSSDQEEE